MIFKQNYPFWFTKHMNGKLITSLEFEDVFLNISQFFFTLGVVVSAPKQSQFVSSNYAFCNIISWYCIPCLWSCLRKMQQLLLFPGNFKSIDLFLAKMFSHTFRKVGRLLPVWLLSPRLLLKRGLYLLSDGKQVQNALIMLLFHPLQPLLKFMI